MTTPAIPQSVTAFIINVFSKNSGAIARTVAGIVVGAIASLLVKVFGYTLTAEENLKLIGYTTAGVTWLIGEWTTYLQNKNVSVMQDALKAVFPDLPVDSHVGPVTVAAVEQLAQEVTTKPGTLPVQS